MGHNVLLNNCESQKKQKSQGWLGSIICRPFDNCFVIIRLWAVEKNSCSLSAHPLEGPPPTTPAAPLLYPYKYTVGLRQHHLLPTESGAAKQAKQKYFVVSGLFVYAAPSRKRGAAHYFVILNCVNYCERYTEWIAVKNSQNKVTVCVSLIVFSVLFCENLIWGKACSW